MIKCFVEVAWIDIKPGSLLAFKRERMWENNLHQGLGIEETLVQEKRVFLKGVSILNNVFECKYTVQECTLQWK